jgi:hypothetical protein
MASHSVSGCDRAADIERHYDEKVRDNQVNRIIKTAAVAAIAAIGVIGTASAAGATVAVTNGVGTVGKGDVQDVLDWDNARFDENVNVTKDVTFTTTYSKVADHTLNCGTYVPGKGIVQTGTVRLLITTPVTQKVNATQVLNGNRKQITGWNLTDLGTATNGPEEREGGICPTGSYDIGTATMSFYDSPHVLKVNGVDLPNTPVV